MRLYKRPDRGGTKINIASLIDVVFLLIIFFMTVSHIAPSEMDLDLPEAKAGELSKDTDLKRFVFNINDAGGVFVLGQEVGTEEAGRLLLEEISMRGADMVEVLIRGDKATEWANVAGIMQICREHGIKRVKVGVVEAE
jgi:biopolymer transport protein ExbD